jgi:hypothetical protein
MELVVLPRDDEDILPREHDAAPPEAAGPIPATAVVKKRPAAAVVKKRPAAAVVVKVEQDHFSLICAVCVCRSCCLLHLIALVILFSSL